MWTGGTARATGLTIATSIRGDGGMPIPTPEATLGPAEDNYFFGCGFP